jgi:hypothetical protein
VILPHPLIHFKKCWLKLMNVENFEMLTCPPTGIRISIHSNGKKNEDVFRLSLGKQNSQPEGEEMDFKPAYKFL